MSNKFAIDKNYFVETVVKVFDDFTVSLAKYNRLREDFELPAITAITT